MGGVVNEPAWQEQQGQKDLYSWKDKQTTEIKTTRGLWKGEHLKNRDHYTQDEEEKICLKHHW